MVKSLAAENAEKSAENAEYSRSEKKGARGLRCAAV
jgi:hypothetical protein